MQSRGTKMGSIARLRVFSRLVSSTMLLWFVLVLGAAPMFAQTAGADQLYNDASAAVRNSDYPQAEFLLREMSSRYPRDNRWGPALIGVLTSEAKTAEALRVGREFALQFGKTSTYYVQMGLLMEKMGQPRDAIEQFQGAVRLNDEPYLTFSAYNGIGDSYMQLDEVDQAIAAYRKAKAISMRASFQLAMALHTKGDLEGAIAEYRELLLLVPNQPTVMNNLAYAYAERGINLKEAEDLALAASGVEPGASPVTDTLGWIYFKQGRLREAEDVLVRALGQEGGLAPTLREHLAAVMDAKGGWTAERRELRGLLERAEKPSEIRRMKELLQKMERE